MELPRKQVNSSICRLYDASKHCSVCFECEQNLFAHSGKGLGSHKCFKMGRIQDHAWEEELQSGHEMGFGFFTFTEVEIGTRH